MEKFSGGNQQKAVLARWMRTEPRVLLLDEPTQGVDVGAKAAIYEQIARAASDGLAVILTSSDAEELVHLCDRVLVMRAGTIAAELAGPSLTEERLVAETLGATSNRRTRRLARESITVTVIRADDDLPEQPSTSAETADEVGAGPADAAGPGGRFAALVRRTIGRLRERSTPR